MENSEEGPNLNVGHVSFGKNLFIDPNKRLPAFDNGASLAYQAYDARNKVKTFVAIVAGVESFPRWTAIPGYNALADTSFMRLVGSGIVRWPTEDRQKYVFIYSGDFGECLVKEGEFSTVSWRHPDIVEYLIQPMVRMFREMGDKNFAHGSVRPSNIFLSSVSQNEPIILGDGLSAQVGSTQPALFFSPSKAMADPMGRGHGSLQDDIYAFGVSLIYFLRKNDEFEDLSDEDIVRKKIEMGSYSALIGRERFQVSFLELLRGILHDEGTQRWGVEEMSEWLDGARLTPPAVIKKKKANRPMNFSGQKYLYAEFLALDLYKNPEEVALIIENGSLTQWVTKSIDDATMTERYCKALERASGLGNTANKDFLVAELGMALNPKLPVYYKGRRFTHDGLGAMLAMSAYEEQDLTYFKDVINLNLIDHALVGAKMNQNLMILVLKQYDSCRSALRQNKMGYGIERCIYILCRNSPCLSTKLKKYFICEQKSVLIVFEKLCKQGGQISLIMDRHLSAFFSVLDFNFMERVLHDLNSGDKDMQVMGNLRFMAGMQKQTSSDPVPAMAGVFLESLSGFYNKAYKSRLLRKSIQDKVKEAAQAGDLHEMSELLDNVDTIARDQRAFNLACNEYKILHNEYNEYNKKLANKKTYGVVNGRDAAAVVSWIAATIITLIVVLAFISGNKVF